MKTIEAYQFVMCAYVDNYTVEPFHCLLASHIWIPYGKQNKTVLINRVLLFTISNGDYNMNKPEHDRSQIYAFKELF